MKFSQTAILAVGISAIAVEAAPAPVFETGTKSLISKRGELEKSLEQFMELRSIRAKRDEISTELSAREYAIVTDVLAAIKDTDIAPVVLKFFVKNATLSNIAIDGVVFVVKSGVLSAKSLLSLLVQSGLVTSVLNDILGDCAVYSSIITIGETLLKSLFKREAGAEITGNVSHDEGVEMLRRDGLISLTGLYDMDVESLDARDIDGIVVNLLESLASSGLGTQVVEAVLTDAQFLSFGAKLIQTLYSDGLISLSSLVSAVTESGILPELLKEILNFGTLEKIAKTAISAATGKCASNSQPVPTKTIPGTSSTNIASGANTKPPLIFVSSTSTATSTGTSVPLAGVTSPLLGGGGILAGITGILDDFFGDSDSAKPASILAASTKTTTTAAATSLYACSTPPLILQKKRMRLY